MAIVGRMVLGSNFQELQGFCFRHLGRHQGYVDPVLPSYVPNSILHSGHRATNGVGILHRDIRAGNILTVGNISDKS